MSVLEAGQLISERRRNVPMNDQMGDDIARKTGETLWGIRELQNQGYWGEITIDGQVPRGNRYSENTLSHFWSALKPDVRESQTMRTDGFF
jgi:hypothetical protein